MHIEQDCSHILDIITFVWFLYLLLQLWCYTNLCNDALKIQLNFFKALNGINFILFEDKIRNPGISTHS